MNWAFELLGLTPDADAASVKRAYARLLRTTRPDEDPEGFQRLNTAYKMVLARVNAQPASPAAAAAAQAQATIKPHSDVPPPSQPSPQSPALSNATMAPVPVVNIDTLTNEVIRAATEANDGESLSRWLHARQEFWSIQLKQESGHRVVNRLFQQPQPMSSECMEALLHFFDMDHVLSGINPIALQDLQARQRTLWEVQPGNHRQLARRMGLMWGSRPDVKALSEDIALLQKPRTWPRVVRVTFRAGRVRELGRLVHTLLGKGNFEELPPSIDREHAFFWFRAAASGLNMTRQRFIIGLLRATLVAVVCGAGCLAVLLLRSANSTSTGSDWADAISASASLAAIVFALWPLFACGAWFDQWQGLPESTPSRFPWLRRLAIPAACAVSFALFEVASAQGATWLVAISFIFALRRFRQRTPATSTLFVRLKNALPIFAWIGGMSASALWHIAGTGFPFVPLMAIATFVISFADLWRYRTQLRPKLARS